MTKEEAEMRIQWPRVLTATAFIVVLVALGALEVLTAKIPLDRDATGAVTRDVAQEREAASSQQRLLTLDYPAGSPSASEDGHSDAHGVEARGGQFLR